jgi:two-component system, OmpR family, response regulator VicR
MAQTILIADDHEEMRELVVELLRGEGYEIRQAADTDAVLDQIKAERPDLVILDVNMPGDGGIAALKTIRGNRALNGMRVLVLSGSVDLAPEWLSDLGADAQLPKPFQIDQLNATVSRLLG